MVSTRKLSWFLFFALALFYLSLSPASIKIMGYTSENTLAAGQIISNLGDWFSFRLAATEVTWPRHGVFELVFQIPFLLVSRLIFGASPEWADRLLSMQPVIATALICTLIFVWVHQLTSSPAWGYVLAAIAAFSTMLWPYAYIGLETTQSLFLLLTGFLALACGGNKNWRHSILLGISAGLAVSMKSNGIYLLPAVGFATFEYLRGDPAEPSGRRWKRSAAVFAIIAAIYLTGAYTRSLSPTWSNGGTLNLFRAMSVDPLTALFNAISLVGSANKGLLVYCPITAVCIALMPAAHRLNSRLVIFAGLTLGGLIGGCSLLYFWSDETWGPRYLHSSIAPLLVCLAVTLRSTRFNVRKGLLVAVLTIWGVAVSFLGVFFYYGILHGAAHQTGVATIETLQYDFNWNHIRFNTELLRAWCRRDQAADEVATEWPPPRHRWYPQEGEPPLAQAPRTVRLREIAFPQPLIARPAPPDEPTAIIRYCQIALFFIGVVLLVLLARLVSIAEKANRGVEAGAPVDG